VGGPQELKRRVKNFRYGSNILAGGKVGRREYSIKFSLFTRREEGKFFLGGPRKDFANRNKRGRDLKEKAAARGGRNSGGGRERG